MTFAPSLAYKVKRALYWGARRVLPKRGLVDRALYRAARVRPDIVDDIARWCDEHAIEHVELSPEQTVTRARGPQPLESPLHPNFARRAVTRIDRRLLTCLPGARVWGKNGLIVLPDGSFAAEAIYGRSHLDQDTDASTPMPRDFVRHSGDFFSLLGEFSNAGNYGHWIHDGLLRLHAVQERLPVGTKYLVPPKMRTYQVESLRLLGIEENLLVRHPRETVWEFERLWFASLPPAGAEVPDAPAWLRERLWAATGVQAPPPRRRLYVSRAAAAWVRISNETELEPALERHRFQIVRTEELSVADQVQLFAEAEAIVAPTGSGQINMMFATSAARILQIMEPQLAEEKAFVFWALAETLGQPFFYLMADTVPNQRYPAFPDIYVDPNRFERCLEQFFNDDTGTGVEEAIAAD